MDMLNARAPGAAPPPPHVQPVYDAILAGAAALAVGHLALTRPAAPRPSLDETLRERLAAAFARRAARAARRAAA
jgi:hypothetical protein